MVKNCIMLPTFKTILLLEVKNCQSNLNGTYLLIREEPNTQLLLVFLANAVKISHER